LDLHKVQLPNKDLEQIKKKYGEEVPYSDVLATIRINTDQAIEGDDYWTISQPGNDVHSKLTAKSLS
jgi:hypothetical protein